MNPFPGLKAIYELLRDAVEYLQTKRGAEYHRRKFERMFLRRRWRAVEFMSKHDLWALALLAPTMWLVFIASRSEVESWARYCADQGSKDPYCAVKMMNKENP